MTNFIREDYLNDKSICDDLINYFHNNPNKVNGAISDGTNKRIDLTIKKSIDLGVKEVDSPVILNYLKELQIILNKYIEEYSYSNKYAPFSMVEPFNIQYYDKNDGYYKWHTERLSNTFPICNRHLVFTTYLNDVDDKGETEFYYQKLKVKPKKGKTVIFPADWTHTHRGIPSPTQEKYITTGWFSFVDKV